ncbi:hypothetical protein EYF80_001403 [Liparis tanakae]|uniref:Uncharacterized protein n=1 Tax=Liparis tanakae TaxID=230148 RepID=A0A4Z2JDY1_9TELE|nr:hypothetical protein EYF80_001403 [Liparis tanakae]
MHITVAKSYGFSSTEDIIMLCPHMTPGTALLLQHKTVKLEVLWDCRCRHDPAERAARPGNAACDPPPEALTDLRRHK